MSQPELLSQQKAAPVQVSHVADFCRRYPGETVTLHTRVELHEPLASVSLRVILPPGLQLEAYGADDLPGAVPAISLNGAETNLIWNFECRGSQPVRYHFYAAGLVEHTQTDRLLESRSSLTCLLDSEPVFVEEWATIAVHAKGRYLKYLPSLYQDDELMGRLLMLFESFLSPLQNKIDSQAEYYDPRFAPPEFLPWLASWTDLTLEPEMDETARRSLVKKAATLLHKRGTRVGLQEYLESFTGGKVQIIEHASENFRLGSEARLGPGIALGTENVPNTFSVYLRLPAFPENLPQEERSLRQRALEHKIQQIIEAEKPVHTGYTVHLEVEPALENVAVEGTEYDG